MGNFNERYGLSGESVNALYKRYFNMNRRDGGHEFASFDDFLLWSIQSDYEPGMRLHRRNIQKHHSPENSFWATPEDVRRQNEDKVKKAEREKLMNASPFCAKCQRFCPNIQNGCPEWRKYFVENWDDNISTRKKLRRNRPEEIAYEREIQKKFVYEHPDLVREGIVYGKT